MVKKKSEKERRRESDMEYENLAIKAMVRTLRKNYKPSFWIRFSRFLDSMLDFILLFIVVIMGLVVVIFLIENPVSLAILCGTILLIIIWRSR